MKRFLVAAALLILSLSPSFATDQGQVVASCPPSQGYTAGQFGNITVDTNGNVCVSIGGSGSSLTVNQGNAGTNAQAWWTQIGDTTNGPVTVNPASTVALATNRSLAVQLLPNSPGVIALGQTTKVNSVPVVTASDQLGPAADTASQAVIPTPTSSSTSGVTPVVGGSAASSLVLKNAAGNLYSVYAVCTSACWLMVFNATSAPSNGATTAGNAASNMVECVPIGAGSVGGINYGVGPPAVYSTGITAAISSTACSTLTLSTVGFIHGMVK